MGIIDDWNDNSGKNKNGLGNLIYSQPGTNIALVHNETIELSFPKSYVSSFNTTFAVNSTQKLVQEDKTLICGFLKITNNSSTYYRDFFKIDLETNTVEEMVAFPETSIRTFSHIIFLDNKELYVFYPSSDVSNATNNSIIVYNYDFTNNKWIKKFSNISVQALLGIFDDGKNIFFCIKESEVKISIKKFNIDTGELEDIPFATNVSILDGAYSMRTSNYNLIYCHNKERTVFCPSFSIVYGSSTGDNYVGSFFFNYEDEIFTNKYWNCGADTSIATSSPFCDDNGYFFYGYRYYSGSSYSYYSLIIEFGKKDSYKYKNYQSSNSMFTTSNIKYLIDGEYCNTIQITSSPDGDNYKKNFYIAKSLDSIFYRFARTLNYHKIFLKKGNKVIGMDNNAYYTETSVKTIDKNNIPLYGDAYEVLEDGIYIIGGSANDYSIQIYE